MRRQINGSDAYVGVISHRRAANVPRMQALCGGMTWYVGEGEAQSYADQGAAEVVESGGLCRSRNAVLDDAFAVGLPAVELSDDMAKIEWATSSRSTVPMPFDRAAAYMLGVAEKAGARLAGAAPTANAFYFNPKRPVHLQAFIVGDFIAVRPTDLRFDEDLRLKEDYDYTLQHLMEYGRIARCNAILAHFAHRSNKGGAVAYRTPALEQETIRALRERWPGMIKDNPRRQDEILLDLSPFK